MNRISTSKLLIAFSCFISPVCLAADYLEPTLVKVPSGHFIMGCVKGRDVPNYEDRQFNGKCPVNEQYPQVVTVDSFLIGAFEVTFNEWDKCQLARACRVIDDFGYGRGQRPISVRAQDIFHYINWLNKVSGASYRLPKERDVVGVCSKRW